MNTNEKLTPSVRWQDFGDLWRNQLRHWSEKGCCKPILGVRRKVGYIVPVWCLLVQPEKGGSYFGILTSPSTAQGSELRRCVKVEVAVLGSPSLIRLMVSVNVIVIIMYIYRALINALSAHMIHINLNIIFYTHGEHSPTKTIYIKYYKIYIDIYKTHYKQTHTHTLTVAETGYWY